MYVLIIHLRCLKIISDLTCLSNTKKSFYFLVLLFMSTIFNILCTSLVSLNFSSNLFMYMGILVYKPWLLRISRCADSFYIFNLCMM